MFLISHGCAQGAIPASQARPEPVEACVCDREFLVCRPGAALVSLPLIRRCMSAASDLSCLQDDSQPQAGFFDLREVGIEGRP